VRALGLVVAIRHASISRFSMGKVAIRGTLVLMVRTSGLCSTAAAAMLVAIACGDGPYSSTPFRCWPAGPEARCPSSDYQCCSDDPAALDLNDLDAPALPAYEGSGGTGTPLFSAARNDASHSGMCVKKDSPPPSVTLVGSGCAVPCNPRWDRESIDAVCGEGALCCQTVEIEAADCVFDPQLGSAGCWRPVRGADIVGLGGLEATGWTADDHASHQDPGRLGCQEFVAGY